MSFSVVLKEHVQVCYANSVGKQTDLDYYKQQLQEKHERL